jgi:iron complex outermembrane recepter protein
MRLALFIMAFLWMAAIPKVYSNNPLENRPPTDANIFGHVVDSITGEHIPFVNLLIKGTRIGTITDASGHYMLTNLPPGDHILIIQSMGYARREIEITTIMQKSIEVDVKLKSTGINLAEVIHTSSPTASGFRYQPDAVFMGEQLQRRSEPSFGEMLNGQPGVAMRSFGSAPSRPVIRGMDGDRILVLENGERMGDIAHTSADHSISLDPLVASRVEVVRGPASLLYGSSALGGVINLMTTDIPEAWDQGISGVVSAQGATMNSMGAGFGRLNWGINDTQAVSARMAMRQAGNLTTPDGELPGTTMRNYDGALGWGIHTPRINGGISASFSDQAFEIPDSPDNPNETIEIRANRMALQGRFGTTLGKGFFDQAQLRFNLSRFDQQEVEIDRSAGVVPSESVELAYDMMAFSSTLTLQHRARGIFARGALGFNASGQRVDVIGSDIYTPGEQRLSLATFTFQEVPMSNQLRFQFGIRLDFNNSQALPNETFPDVSQNRNSFNYSGSMGLNYRPLEGLEIGGQLARSHRNPMVEELFANGPHLGAGVYERGNINLKDEIGHGADLFARYSSSRIDLELTGFVNDFRNYIIFQPTAEVDEASGYPVFEYIGGEAMLMGSEFVTSIRITPQLELTTGFDYVHGQRRIDEGSDEYLPVIPPFRINSTLEYDFGWGWLGSNYRIVSRQSRVAPEEDVTDGYSLLGFQAGYRLNLQGRHVILLRVDNALNTRYRDHLSRIEDRNFLMPGRNVNITYRWFF